MLGMLVGHAGDVEHDAGDVDGLVKCVNFARKCCKIRHFTGPDEKQKNPKNESHPIYIHIYIYYVIFHMAGLTMCRPACWTRRFKGVRFSDGARGLYFSAGFGADLSGGWGSMQRHQLLVLSCWGVDCFQRIYIYICIYTCMHIYIYIELNYLYISSVLRCFFLGGLL